MERAIDCLEKEIDRLQREANRTDKMRMQFGGGFGTPVYATIQQLLYLILDHLKLAPHKTPEKLELRPTLPDCTKTTSV